MWFGGWRLQKTRKRRDREEEGERGGVMDNGEERERHVEIERERERQREREIARENAV